MNPERSGRIPRALVLAVLLLVTGPGPARADAPGELAGVAALHRQGYGHAAAAKAGALAERADAPPELLRWLARLAFELPEASQVVERLERYAEVGGRGDVLELLDGLDAPALRRELAFRLGRYRHQAGRAPAALRALAAVDAPPRREAEARILAGVIEVEQRRPARALRSFDGALRSLASVEEPAASARLRDLAHLSIARTLYSTAFRSQPGGVAVDQVRLEAAIEAWSRVTAGGEHWADALFERAWAQLISGDPGRSLGSLHALDAPFVAPGRYPEAQLLRALVAASICRDGDAEAARSAMVDRYGPARRDLAALQARHRVPAGDHDLVALARAARAGTLRHRARAVLARELGDRALGRDLELVDSIDAERARLARSTPGLRDSALGREAADALDLAREIAVGRAAAQVRERLGRAEAELGEQLEKAARLADALRRGVPRRPASAPAIVADDEHVVWPFDGEYWRDEVEGYAGVLTSECGAARRAAPPPAATR